MEPYQLPDEQLQIPPGFIMLERSRDHVLAFCPDGTLGRYATWLIGREGIMYSGHYFGDPLSAATDYKKRRLRL